MHRKYNGEIVVGDIATHCAIEKLFEISFRGLDDVALQTLWVVLFGQHGKPFAYRSYRRYSREIKHIENNIGNVCIIKYETVTSIRRHKAHPVCRNLLFFMFGFNTVCFVDPNHPVFFCCVFPVIEISKKPDK